MTTLLVDSEWDKRLNRSIERSTKNARFCYKSMIEQLSNDAGKGFDKNQIHWLADGGYIRENETILITRPTGTSKSFLSSALGHLACQQNFKVFYANTIRLFAQLRMAKADGSGIRELAKIEKQDLLILDDFGLQPMNQELRLTLLQLLEDRYGKKSIIITSQLPVAKWHEYINDPTLADAILDRILFNAKRIELKGESLRKKWAKKIETVTE